MMAQLNINLRKCSSKSWPLQVDQLNWNLLNDYIPNSLHSIGCDLKKYNIILVKVANIHSDDTNLSFKFFKNQNHLTLGSINTTN